MTRVLITGAGGFTGRYLTAELAGAGYEVCGMFGERPENLAHSDAVVCDLLDRDRVAEFVQAAKPDLVAHLAGIAFVAHGDVDAIYRTNIIGSRNLLEALAGLKTPPRMTLLASSANVYGNAVCNPITESTPPSPANDYAVSKLAMEHLAGLYMDRLPIVITRPFNYTGRGQSTSFIIPKVVRHVQQRAATIELGNIDVARDFTDVRTVVHYYRQLLEHGGARGLTVNICSGQAYTLRQVLAMVQEIAGHAMEVRVNPALLRSNEVKVLQGSRQRLTSLVGEAVDIPFRETLRWMLGEEP